MALRSRAGTVLEHSGRYALREFRSHADDDVWICHLGTQRQDGGFEAFCAAVGALEIAYEADRVRLRTLRGDILEFSWSGPFLKNGDPVPLRDFPHFDNPHVQAPLPASGLTIRIADESHDLRW